VKTKLEGSGTAVGFTSAGVPTGGLPGIEGVAVYMNEVVFGKPNVEA
jgi:hypothetical protein